MNALDSKPTLGYVSILLCCLSTAISFVFIAHLNKTHNQMLSIAITFSYAAILFNLLNFKKIGSLYSSVAANLKLIFKMNIVTLFNWVSSFMSLNYIDPATAICINLSVLTVTLFFIFTPLGKIKENKHLVYSVLLILVSMALIIKQHVDTALLSNSRMIILGVVWSVFGGLSGAFIGLSSEGMGKANFSVTQILATRFYLLIIVSGIAFFFVPDSVPVVIDWKYYLLSSLVIVIFPLVMYQTAIMALGALIVSLLEPFTPVITYLLQIAVGDYKFNLLTVILLVVSSSAVIWFVRIEQNLARAKRLKTNENTLGQAIHQM
jgi:drug/metabolite transporter (DMT)-like permease